MRILYYIHDLHIGGAETIVSSYLIELKKRGHEVVMLCNAKIKTPLSTKLENEGINIISLFGKRYEHPFLKVLSVLNRKIRKSKDVWIRVLEDFRPDIIHIHTDLRFVPIPLLFNKNVVYTFHGDVIRTLSIKGKREEQRIDLMADKGMSFFSLSKRMSTDIMNIFNSQRIYYVPNSIDFSKVIDSRIEKSRLSEFGIPDNAFVVGSVGRISEVKNIRRQIEIFAELAKVTPNAYYMMVGGGNHDLENELKRYAIEKRVADKFLFIGERKDATSIMSLFDVFLLTSVAESFSLVLLEAQVLNIKSVVSDVVPNEVVCNDNVTTLSLQSPDEIWVKAILSEQETSRNNNLSQFSRERVIDKLIHNYSIIIKEKRKDE